MNQVKENGKCKCGQGVTKVNNSILPTCRTDGVRFIYTDEPDKGWCIYRCKNCKEVIDEVWTKRNLKLRL